MARDTIMIKMLAAGGRGAGWRRRWGAETTEREKGTQRGGRRRRSDRQFSISVSEALTDPLPLSFFTESLRKTSTDVPQLRHPPGEEPRERV